MYIGCMRCSGRTECTDLVLTQRQIVKHLEGGFGPPGFGPNIEQVVTSNSTLCLQVYRFDDPIPISRLTGLHAWMGEGN